jgi:hypothetical protein
MQTDEWTEEKRTDRRTDGQRKERQINKWTEEIRTERQTYRGKKDRQTDGRRKEGLTEDRQMDRQLNGLTEGQANRMTDRQRKDGRTDRQTETQTESETERQTEGEKEERYEEEGKRGRGMKVAGRENEIDTEEKKCTWKWRERERKDMETMIKYIKKRECERVGERDRKERKIIRHKEREMESERWGD